jgi:hypothetical protein
MTHVLNYPMITDEGKLRLKNVCNYCQEEITDEQTFSLPCFVQHITIDTLPDDLSK